MEGPPASNLPAPGASLLKTLAKFPFLEEHNGQEEQEQEEQGGSERPLALEEDGQEKIHRALEKDVLELQGSQQEPGDAPHELGHQEEMRSAVADVEEVETPATTASVNYGSESVDILRTMLKLREEELEEVRRQLKLKEEQLTGTVEQFNRSQAELSEAKRELVSKVEMARRTERDSFRTSMIWESLRLQRLCEQCQLGWVRVSFLRANGAKPLPRRQELPREALVVGSPPDGVNWWVVSHPWLADKHPDIEGCQLVMLLDKLQRNGAMAADVVFFDFFSMFQKGWDVDDRNQRERRLFSTALKAINSLYTSPGCKVIILPCIPPFKAEKFLFGPDPALKCSGEVEVRGNSTGYAERGWCFFELLISTMCGTCIDIDDDCQEELRKMLFVLFNGPILSSEATRMADECLRWLLHSPSIPSLEEFQEVLEHGGITLVRVGYLRQLAHEERPWPRWQELQSIRDPEERYRVLLEDDPAKHPHGKNADIPQVYTISIPWSPGEGEDTRLLSEYNLDLVAKLQRREARDHDLVFCKYMSMPTEPFTPRLERRKFRKADRVVHWMFMSARFRVILLSKVNRGVKRYHRRAHCLFEMLLATFSGTLAPEEEEVRLVVLTLLHGMNDKVFTCGRQDWALVSRLLKRMLYERFNLGSLAYKESLNFDASEEACREEYEEFQCQLRQWHQDTEEDAYSEVSYYCFPSCAQVDVRSRGGLVPMSELRLGDEVRVRSGHYEPVMLFAHRATDITVEFCALTLAGSGGRLLLTPSHLVPLADGRRLPARSICVGDQLLSSRGHAVPVERTGSCLARGLFQPKTPSGELCVDGVLCCTFNAPAPRRGGHGCREGCGRLARRCLYLCLAAAWRACTTVGRCCSRLAQAVVEWARPENFASGHRPARGRGLPEHDSALLQMRWLVPLVLSPLCICSAATGKVAAPATS